MIPPNTDVFKDTMPRFLPTNLYNLLPKVSEIPEDQSVSFAITSDVEPTKKIFDAPV